MITTTETIMMDILILLPCEGMPLLQKLSHRIVGETPKTWDEMVASVQQIADNYTDEEPVAVSGKIPADVLAKCTALNLFVMENTYQFSINDGEAYAMVQNRIA